MPDLVLGRPDPQRLEVALERATGAQVTYVALGETLTRSRPVRRRAVEVGHGGAAFQRARDGLRRWVCHAGIGARLHPVRPVIEVGTTMVVALPVGPLTVLAPTRIVAVVDEPDRFGFAYGTLPGHPERGEESFLVERDPDGTVRAEVAVAARPIPVLRPVGPAILLAQRRAVRRYLEALRTHTVGQP